MEKKLQIAIDPGIKATGIAVFANGRAIDTKAIIPKPASWGTIHERRKDLVTKTCKYLVKMEKELGCEISQFAIESFQKHKKRPVPSLMSLAETKGYLTASLEERFDVVRPTLHINKRTAPKRDAQMIARAIGVKGTADECDALHIGVLAGFYYGQ